MTFSLVLNNKDYIPLSSFTDFVGDIRVETASTFGGHSVQAQRLQKRFTLSFDERIRARAGEALVYSSQADVYDLSIEEVRQTGNQTICLGRIKRQKKVGQPWPPP